MTQIPIRDHTFWRRNFHPGDPTYVTEQIKRQPDYLEAIDTLKESYRSLLAFLKKIVQFNAITVKHEEWGLFSGWLCDRANSIAR